MGHSHFNNEGNLFPCQHNITQLFLKYLIILEIKGTLLSIIIGV